MNVCSKDRREEGRYQASSVDGEVEQRKEVPQILRLFRQFELVSTERGHARLNAARAEGNEQQC